MTRGMAGLALRLAVSAGLLAALVLVVAEPRTMVDVLGRLSPLWAMAALGLTVADRVLMALKWRLLLTSRGVALPALTAIRAYFATSFAGLLLPVTVGADAIRVMVVRRYGVYDVTASIVVERTLGALAVFSVAVAALAAAGSGPRIGGGARLAMILGLTGLLAALFLLSLHLAARFGPRLEGTKLAPAARLAGAYAAYRGHGATLTAFYLLSVIECLFPVLITWAAARGLGFALPFTVFAVSMPLALIVARLPISLGGFGVQEAGFVYVAGTFGVQPTDALAIMLVADAVLMLALLPAAFDTDMLSLGRRQDVPTGGPAAGGSQP
jgi:uncharacterized membrane protein YbhN (UPF0104 family)